MTRAAPYVKAAVSGVVTLCAYLVGVIPAEGGFSDVSTVQWLGAVVFVGAAYGLTYNVPYHPKEKEKTP